VPSTRISRCKKLLPKHQSVCGLCGRLCGVGQPWGLQVTCGVCQTALMVHHPDWVYSSMPITCLLPFMFDRNWRRPCCTPQQMCVTPRCEAVMGVCVWHATPEPWNEFATPGSQIILA
jgi:hypothetical protein